MSGSEVFRIRISPSFEESIVALERATYARADKNGREEFRNEVIKVINNLDGFPHVAGLRKEPFPPNTASNVDGWTLHKLEFSCPRANGPHRQGRVMILVDLRERLIILLSVYTHGQFPGRIPNDSLKNLIIKAARASQPAMTAPDVPRPAVASAEEK